MKRPPRNFEEALQRLIDTGRMVGVPERVIAADVAKLRQYKRDFKAEALRIHRRRL